MEELTPINGFKNVPISKLICITSIILPLFISIFQLKMFLDLSIDPHIVKYFQYFRIFTFQFSVTTESDYLLSIILWIHFKVLERLYGSRKFLSVIILFWVYNTIICVTSIFSIRLFLKTVCYLVELITKRRTNFDKVVNNLINPVNLGPLGIISSLYECYCKYIPKCYQFEIELHKKRYKTHLQNKDFQKPLEKKKITISNFFFLHVVYLIILFNNMFKSIIPCLVGLMIGKYYVGKHYFLGKNLVISESIFSFIVNPKEVLKLFFQKINKNFLSGYRFIGDRKEILMYN